MKFVAITACNEGLVYSYIAKEALEKAIESTGDQIRIERVTAYGVDAPLTNQEIKDADAVLIVSDVIFDIKRFKHKKMVFATTKDAITDPIGLLQRLRGRVNES